MRSNFFRQKEVLAVIIVLLLMVFTQPVQAAHSLCPDVIPSSNQHAKEIMSSLEAGLLEPEMDSDDCAFVDAERELTLGEAIKAMCRASSMTMEVLPDASCQPPADEASLAGFDWEFATCVNNLYKNGILKTYTDQVYPSSCPDASQPARMDSMISMLARTVLSKPGVADGFSMYKVLSRDDLYDGPALGANTSWGLPSPYVRYLHTITCGRELGFDASSDFSDRTFSRSHVSFEDAANLLQHLHTSEDCAKEIEVKLESTSLRATRISFIMGLLKKYHVVPDAQIESEAENNAGQNFPSNGNIDLTPPSEELAPEVVAPSNGNGIVVPAPAVEPGEVVAPSNGAGIVVPAPAEEPVEIVAPSNGNIDLSNVGSGSAVSSPSVDYTPSHIVYGGPLESNGTNGSIENSVDVSGINSTPLYTITNGSVANTESNGTYTHEDAFGSVGGGNVVNGNLQAADSDDRTVSVSQVELSPEAENTLTHLSDSSALGNAIGANTNLQTSLQPSVGNLGSTSLPGLSSSGSVTLPSSGSEEPSLQLQRNAENAGEVGEVPSIGVPLNIEIAGSPVLSPEELAEQERQAALNAFHEVDAAAEANAREQRDQELDDATHSFLETDRALSAEEEKAQEEEEAARRAFQLVAEAAAQDEKAGIEAEAAAVRNLFRTVDAEKENTEEESSDEETDDTPSEREILNLLK